MDEWMTKITTKIPDICGECGILLFDQKKIH